MVMLVRDIVGFSGYAYIQTAFVNGADFEGFAFAVANDLLSVDPDSHTFSHEVGHLLGMNHDIANATPSQLSSASFPWSFGWQDAQANVRDIMSYGTTCLPSCNRVLNFSNPEINFTGTSVASGTFVTDVQGRSAFNALTGSALALAVSEFRGPPVVDRVFRGGFETLERPTP